MESFKFVFKLRFSLHSVQMRKNMDQRNSEYSHFSHSAVENYLESIHFVVQPYNDHPRIRETKNLLQNTDFKMRIIIAMKKHPFEHNFKNIISAGESITKSCF